MTKDRLYRLSRKQATYQKKEAINEGQENKSKSWLPEGSLPPCRAVSSAFARLARTGHLVTNDHARRVKKIEELSVLSVVTAVSSKTMHSWLWPSRVVSYKRPLLHGPRMARAQVLVILERISERKSHSCVKPGDMNLQATPP